MAGPILVVDDDTLVQATVKSILEDEGYAVETANDGVDALAKLDGSLPALVLLDITMPRMDGYAFAEQVASRGLRSQLPIVVLTADGRAQQKAAQVGAVGYVSKPFTLDGLLDAVARALD